MIDQLPSKIKKIRKALKLSQSEMAKRLGIHVQTLSKYERGEQIPSAETLLTLLREMPINVTWLIASVGEMMLGPVASAEAVFGRLMKVLNTKTRDKIEEELGLVPGYLSLSYLADPASDLPHDAIVRFCIKRGISLDWIYSGEGKAFRLRQAKDSLPVDSDFVKEITKTVEKFLQKEKLRITSKKKARLITHLYDKLSAEPSNLDDELFVGGIMGRFLKIEESQGRTAHSK
jgi:transcriptional regulator with XRE-family HTH domain